MNTLAQCSDDAFQLQLEHMQMRLDGCPRILITMGGRVQKSVGTRERKRITSGDTSSGAESRPKHEMPDCLAYLGSAGYIHVLADNLECVSGRAPKLLCGRNMRIS